ncbi:uncharacterized protein LOC112467562 [Temnothorax curvispinosus]|uniref:Uncharacterized protein LOC112467562 n=1 Tax=Temnothorax curvispinosus TaxID=300111 RepID=A0A6J1RCN2_9HYME|nr:uncharacterized protein LOC112467562 [Temnothorax curvispinosus]
MPSNATSVMKSAFCVQIYLYVDYFRCKRVGMSRKQQQSNYCTKFQSSCISLIPRTVSHLYNCQDELQLFSGRVSEITDMNNPYLQSIETPSLITAACNLLNTLIFVGQHEIVRQVYEYSISIYSGRKGLSTRRERSGKKREEQRQKG